MTIASEITRLQTAKSDIKTAIESKGVSVPSSAKLDIYYDYINSISQGEEVYKGEYIEYKMNADGSGNLYVPVGGFSHTGTFNNPYSCKISDGSNVVNNFVPCYRKSDNVIGLYDLVNNQFYTNSGSGTFTKGPDVN